VSADDSTCATPAAGKGGGSWGRPAGTSVTRRSDAGRPDELSTAVRVEAMVGIGSAAVTDMSSAETGTREGGAAAGTESVSIARTSAAETIMASTGSTTAPCHPVPRQGGDPPCAICPA
jgi:hypothetical protein